MSRIPAHDSVTWTVIVRQLLYYEGETCLPFQETSLIDHKFGKLDKTFPCVTEVGSWLKQTLKSHPETLEVLGLAAAFNTIRSENEG